MILDLSRSQGLQKISEEEEKSLRQDVDMYTRRLQEKIDIIKNRYNQYYLELHPRRKDE